MIKNALPMVIKLLIVVCAILALAYRSWWWCGAAIARENMSLIYAKLRAHLIAEFSTNDGRFKKLRSGGHCLSLH
jgi:hypothetical protein